VMSDIRRRMDNPACSQFSSYAKPDLVGITTLPRNSRHLTDHFSVHKWAVNLSCAQNLNPLHGGSDKGDHFLLSPARM
jgi:hypothetical protein